MESTKNIKSSFKKKEAWHLPSIIHGIIRSGGSGKPESDLLVLPPSTFPTKQPKISEAANPWESYKEFRIWINIHSGTSSPLKVKAPLSLKLSVRAKAHHLRTPSRTAGVEAP